MSQTREIDISIRDEISAYVVVGEGLVGIKPHNKDTIMAADMDLDSGDSDDDKELWFVPAKEVEDLMEVDTEEDRKRHKARDYLNVVNNAKA